MKVFKLFASLLGIFAILFGNNGCKKDDECCTLTYAGQSETWCEDDDDWQTYYASWEVFKDYIESYGGNCD